MGAFCGDGDLGVWDTPFRCSIYVPRPGGDAYCMVISLHLPLGFILKASYGSVVLVPLVSWIRFSSAHSFRLGSGLVAWHALPGLAGMSRDLLLKRY